MDTAKLLEKSEWNDEFWLLMCIIFGLYSIWVLKVEDCYLEFHVQEYHQLVEKHKNVIHVRREGVSFNKESPSLFLLT